jgi:hypothetical protein
MHYCIATDDVALSTVLVPAGLNAGVLVVERMTSTAAQ